VIPQALWLPPVRRSLPALFAISLLLNIGMWLERILIILMTLTHGHLPSRWTFFVPTAWDWLFLFAPLGFFAFMFLCLVRLVPVASMHEMRKLVYEEGGT
jgi:molybdopterin-containing oxidoreductase family membrane subunit